MPNSTGHLRIVSIWTLIVSVSLTALVGIVVLIFPDFRNEGQVLGSGALVAVYSLVCLGCAVMMARGRARKLLWVPIVTLGAALLVWLLFIWFERSMRGNIDELVARIGGTFTFIGFASLHASLMFQPTLRSKRTQITRVFAILSAAVVALILTLLIWEIINEGRYDDLIWRGVGVVVIIGSLATLLTLAFSRLDAIERAYADDSPMNAKIDVELTCPRCGLRQNVRSNHDSRCTRCRLSIRVEVEEPRCDCGYLLLGLDADVCPECGRPIKAEDKPSETPAHPKGQEDRPTT